MYFSSTHGTLALQCVCCWWLPDYLHGLPAASLLLRVVSQSKSLTSWQLCFLLMALMWPVCFTLGYGWGIQRVCMQGNAALVFCFCTHRNSKWAMGHHYSVRGSWSWSYKSIWRWFPLESQIAQKQLHVPVSMPFLSFMCHCWVLLSPCVCVHLWVFNTTHR